MTLTPFTLPQRLRRFFVAGLALLLPGAVLALFLIPVKNTIRDLQAQLETRTEAVSRMRSLIVSTRYKATDVTPEVTSALASDFLSGTQDSLIVAELQNRLRTLANASSVDLNSANALPSKMVENLTYLGLRVVLRGQIADIQRILHGIEFGSPMLFVERASLRLDTWPIKSADPARDGAPALVAELDIYGVRQLAAIVPPSPVGEASSPSEPIRSPSIVGAQGVVGSNLLPVKVPQ